MLHDEARKLLIEAWNNTHNVKEIAVLHGGNVCVESSSEKGTTFAVRLPLIGKVE
ncbi:hypothetical protein [Ruminococcus sp.]